MKSFGPAGTKTPLHCAVASGQLGLVRYLVGKGADPNLLDGDSATPLHMAGAYGRRDAKMIRLLVELGADIRRRDLVGRTLADYLGEDSLNEILAGR